MTSAGMPVPRLSAQEADVLGRRLVRNHDEQIIVAVRGFLTVGAASKQVDRFGRQHWHNPVQQHGDIAVGCDGVHRLLDRSMSSTGAVSPW